MTYHVQYVWDGETIEDFIDKIIKNPTDTFILDVGTEWMMGRYNRDHTQIHHSKDSAFLDKLDGFMDFLADNPNVKSRIYYIDGSYGDVTTSDNHIVTDLDLTDTHKKVKNIWGKKSSWWNYHWCHYAQTLERSSGMRVIDHLNAKPKDLYIALNHRPHPHRISSVKAQLDLGLHQRGRITWCNTSNAWQEFYGYIVEEIGQGRFKPDGMTGTVLRYSREFDPDALNTNRGHVPANCQDSLFEVVCETTERSMFITEKTFKPIFFGKPWVVLGATRHNTVLKNLGFETFPEYFDLSSDDTTFPDQCYQDQELVKQYHYEHYHKILKPLTNISDTDYDIIKSESMPKILHNQNVMVKYMLDPEVIPDFVMPDHKLFGVRLREYQKQIREFFRDHDHFGQFV